MFKFRHGLKIFGLCYLKISVVSVMNVCKRMNIIFKLQNYMCFIKINIFIWNYIFRTASFSGELQRFYLKEEGKKYFICRTKINKSISINTYWFILIFSTNKRISNQIFNNSWTSRIRIDILLIFSPVKIFFYWSSQRETTQRNLFLEQ